jgi:CRISPR-associated protein Cas2
MARRFILVSYDIADDRRRNKVFKTLLDYGDRIQYSVFCCQVTRQELHRLKEQLRNHVAFKEDRILFVDVGKVANQKPSPEIAYIGQKWTPEERCQIV